MLASQKKISRTNLFANILIKVLRQKLVVKYVIIVVFRSTYRNMRKPKQVHKSTTESSGPVTCSQDVKGHTEGLGLDEVLVHKNKCSDNMNIIFTHDELCFKSLLETTFRDPLRNKHPVSCRQHKKLCSYVFGLSQQGIYIFISYFA